MHTLVVSSNVVDAVSTRLRSILRTKVDHQGPAVAQYEDVEKHLSQGKEEMLVVVLSPDPERGLDALRRVRKLMPGYVLAVGQASEPKLILRALQEGADHFLDEAELETGLDAALARLQSKQEAAPVGRLITVLGASGGSGASTLAVNIASVLAKDHERCALIDLKPGRGDLAALLDLKPAFHLADLCVNVARLDRAMFEKVLVRHQSGVHLLASPQVFGDTRLVTPQGVAQILTMARKLFAHVVVDLEDCFHEEQLMTLRQATAILLVSRLDFTSLRNMRRILDYMAEHDVPRSKVRLVVNRYGQPNELPVSEAEEALGTKLSYYVPDDPRTINKANNTGIPAVVKKPSAKVSQALAQLARGALDRRRGESNGQANGLVKSLSLWR
jgi:pilus assembly protein CpaE